MKTIQKVQKSVKEIKIITHNFTTPKYYYWYLDFFPSSMTVSGTISFVVSKPTIPSFYKRLMIHCSPTRDSLNQIFFKKDAKQQEPSNLCQKLTADTLMVRASFSPWPQRKKRLWITPAASPTLEENDQTFLTDKLKVQGISHEKEGSTRSDERYYSFIFKSAAPSI